MSKGCIRNLNANKLTTKAPVAKVSRFAISLRPGSTNSHFSPEIYCNTVSGSICRRCLDNCPQLIVRYVYGIWLSHIRQSCRTAGIRRFVTISCEKYGLSLTFVHFCRVQIDFRKKLRVKKIIHIFHFMHSTLL